MTAKRFTAEELRRRRNRQWYESRARCGHIGICPICGGYTRSKKGIHPSCARKEGMPGDAGRKKRGGKC